MNLPFQFWKEALRLDCEQQGKLEHFSYLSDLALYLFYERGCKPSVQCLLEDAEKVA